jgi:hypothetical protein
MYVALAYRMQSFRVYRGVEDQKEQMLSLIQSELTKFHYQLAVREENGFTTKKRFYVSVDVEQDHDSLIARFLVRPDKFYWYLPIVLCLLSILFAALTVPLSWIFPNVMFEPSPWGVILVISSFVFIFFIPTSIIGLKLVLTWRFLRNVIDNAAKNTGLIPIKPWKKTIPIRRS